MTLAMNGYDVTWWTVDGGGGTSSTGVVYPLGGISGQPDAGLMEGGGYALAGGFRPGGAAAEPEYLLYLPLGMRAYWDCAVVVSVLDGSYHVAGFWATGTLYGATAALGYCASVPLCGSAP